jgi:uncharacterized protein YjbJ (UPF0337 family)
MFGRFLWLSVFAGAATAGYYWLRGKRGDDVKLEGGFDSAKGKVKSAYGNVTGDTGTELEGDIERAKGRAKENVGEFMDRMERAS